MRVTGSRIRCVCSGRWALAMVAFCLVLGACGAAGASSAPLHGWTDITPPDSGQRAQYAVSPDTPGLILATIGGSAQESVAPPPPARLWRSRDGGASWQSLDSLSVRSGTSLAMPPGGKGLVFAQDPLEFAISVSEDAGTTWRTLPSDPPPNALIGAEWTWLAGAVVVGGRLYAGGAAPGFGGMPAGTSRFSVSDDHGVTWRAVEASADPAGAGAVTQAIAPLNAAGSAWLRLVVVGGYGPSTHFAVERSADGGVSWRLLSTTLPSEGWFRSAAFSADPTHPGHICATLTTYDDSTGATPTAGGAFHGGAAIVTGPPAPEPQDVALLASDDGGMTWRGGEVSALRRVYGGVVPAGVRMSADASCYLATSQSGGFSGAQPDAEATLWRLAPGAQAATALFTMTGRSMLSLFLAPGASGASERVIALTRISGPGDGQQISCGQGCLSYRDGGIYRLVWEPLQAA